MFTSSCVYLFRLFKASCNKLGQLQTEDRQLSGLIFLCEEEEEEEEESAALIFLFNVQCLLKHVMGNILGNTGLSVSE